MGRGEQRASLAVVRGGAPRHGCPAHEPSPRGAVVWEIDQAEAKAAGAPGSVAGSSAKHGPVGLARAEQRETLEALDLLGRLEPRDARRSNQDRHSSRSNVRRCLDEGRHPLAHERIGVAHRHGVADGRVRLEHRFDLGRRDVLAPADDDVLSRPTIVSQPSSSTVARSPVRNQPPGAMTAAVVRGIGIARRRARVRGPTARPGRPRAARSRARDRTPAARTSPTARPSVSRARSKGSASVLVVTVGASVDP